jgi:hypothetical protein
MCAQIEILNFVTDRPLSKKMVGQSHFLTVGPVGRSQNFGRTKSIIDSSIFHTKERTVNRVGTCGL